MKQSKWKRKALGTCGFICITNVLQLQLHIDVLSITVSCHPPSEPKQDTVADHRGVTSHACRYNRHILYECMSMEELPNGSS